jgi:hypothetical protein
MEVSRCLVTAAKDFRRGGKSRPQSTGTEAPSDRTKFSTNRKALGGEKFQSSLAHKLPQIGARDRVSQGAELLAPPLH